VAEQEIAEKSEREKYADRNPPFFQTSYRYPEKKKEDYRKNNAIENRIIDKKKSGDKYSVKDYFQLSGQQIT